MNRFIILVVIAATTLASCHTSQKVSTPHGKIAFNFIQINDVYEIAPLEGGKTGGMARVAYLSKRMKAENPNSFLVMAGDFLSPSVYNSLKVDGERVRGRQMVEAMNAAGTDIAIFGNHEFDITEKELQQRINESSFAWISSNAFHKTANTQQPFIKTHGTISEPLPEYVFKDMKSVDGVQLRVGFIGVVLPFNKANYVSYSDPLETFERLYNKIKDSCDLVVALTHQSMEDDIRLAERLPNLALIMGGHEHDMRKQLIGNVWILKAHANARTAFITNVVFDRSNKSIEVMPRLVEINEKVPVDNVTQAVVDKWNKISNENFASIGFDAHAVVLQKGEPLDGRESEVRSRPTSLTRLVVKAMEWAAPEADVAIVNSGSIRVDDILTMPVTQYDFLRALPFGGSLAEVEMKGALLRQILNTGEANRGIGGFLQYSDKISDSAHNEWTINGMSINDSTNYRVVLTDFLLTGGEANLDYLTDKNPMISKVFPVRTAVSDPRSDIRLAIIRYVKAMKN
ncbi:MAG: bifunctional metallophosphatase/5'-nucleotidase [Chitinophagaceae bacterium]|nr:MAG: bifunctional metallophosphatase/5'-nucleotidase [Chitinophagaceae bacterium]